MNERNGNADTRRPKMVPKATQVFEDAFPHATQSDMHRLMSDLLTEQIKTNLLLGRIEKILEEDLENESHP